MKTLPFHLAYLVLSTFLIAGCGKKTSSPMDAHLNTGLYTNSFFGFTIAVPTNWVVLNKTDIDNASSRPAPSPKQMRNPATGQMFNMPDMEMHNLITLVQETNLFPDTTLTALGTTNLSFSVFGQNVQFLEEIHTGKDYLGMLAGIFEITTLPNHDDLTNTGPSEVLVGGRKFYHDTFRRNMKTTYVRQRIYSRVDNGYALIFVLTAPTEGDLDKLEQIMATVQFH
jgi:hypothetical protein